VSDQIELADRTDGARLNRTEEQDSTEQRGKTQQNRGARLTVAGRAPRVSNRILGALSAYPAVARDMLA
jgi:hypothetical protein